MFKDALRAQIDESGLSVAVVAERAEIPETTLYAWLRGHGEPTMSRARPLVRVLPGLASYVTLEEAK